MPRGFNFPFGGVKLWTTIRSSAATEDRDDAYYIPVARLAPGWTAPAAEEELERIHADLAARYPEVEGVYTGIRVKPIREALNFAWEVLRLGLSTLLGAVLFLLAIACVNVASLTLARARARSREVAVRSAVGAGRGRIARQLLTESLLLAVAGGTLGVLLAHWVVGLVAPFVPEDLFRVGEVAVDRTVLAFSLGVTLLTPLVFGLAPALHVTGTGLSTALRQGGGGGRGSLRARRLLVVAELALAVVLVTGTGLMVRSFLRIRQVDLGFDADRILTAEMTPPASDYAGPAEYGTYFQRAVGTLGALPGVEAVGQVYPLPLNHEAIHVLFALPESEPADRNRWPSALWASVDTGYFNAMGIHHVAGRTFAASDVGGGATVVVVNRTLAERYFPKGAAVGRTLTLASGDTALSATVVGVVADVLSLGFEDAPAPAQIYRPQTQNPRRRRFLVLRTAGAPGTVAGPARRALLDLDPDLPAALRPMNGIVLENAYQWSVGALFLGVFGLVAVLLAGLGVYGLVSYSVAQRHREIGVRVALGAEARDVRRLVAREGLWLATIGGTVGVAAAVGLGR
ncbi:MAG TPA: FtsX-like permease family protein, partial [Longimicrobiales bacterium]|nr:FtsX-like permease family protein [Longimicrobiales bacterium]